MKKIFLAGTMLVDKLAEIDAYPSQGQLTKIKNASVAVGGLVPNVGVDLKALDPTLTVVASARVGDDGEGKFLTDYLSKKGLDVKSVTVDPDKGTSFSFVASVIGGQRTFFTYAGACAEYGVQDVPFERIEKGDLFHLGYFLLLDKVDAGEGLKILKRAKERGAETSIDLVSENSERYSLVLPCLPFVDDLIVNETEAGKLTSIEPKTENLRSIAEKLFSLGVKKRVIIHTPEVGVYLDENGFSYLPSFELEKDFIKGTTGAGDAFCAGALYGICSGFSGKEILETASYSATANLTATDSVGGARTLAEAKELCKNLIRRKICL